MKRTADEKIEQAFYYAVNFYSTNDRSLEKQHFCLKEMMKYGLDMDTCIRIQNPVMSIIRYGEMVDIGNQAIQNQLRIVTDQLRNRLLDLQPTLKPDSIKELPNIPIIGGTGTGNKTRGKDGVNVQVKNIVQDITINGYKGQKALVMSNYDLEPHDMNYLSGTMPSNYYNFTLVDFGNNPRVGATGLDYLLKGATGMTNIQQGNTNISVMYQGMLTRSGFNIVKLNLENCNLGDTGTDILGHALTNNKLSATREINVSGNNITDNGAFTIAEALKTGKFPTLKRLDASGNDISLVGEKFMLDALKHPSTQSVMLLLKRSNDLKVIFSGTKEEKQNLIRETLQTVKDNGVDVKNIAISKGIFGFLDNLGYVISDFSLGFAKCNIIPENIETFAIEAITAKISKKAIAANTAKDAVVCFFDTVDKVSTSSEGIQLIKDLDLVGVNSVIDSIE